MTKLSQFYKINVIDNFLYLICNFLIKNCCPIHVTYKSLLGYITGNKLK